MRTVSDVERFLEENGVRFQGLGDGMFIVADENTLRHREYPASRGRQRVLQNRDIIRMFETLRVSDSFLLQTNLREILFRKPAYLTPDSLGI